MNRVYVKCVVVVFTTLVLYNIIKLQMLTVRSEFAGRNGPMIVKFNVIEIIMLRNIQITIFTYLVYLYYFLQRASINCLRFYNNFNFKSENVPQGVRV
jgi:hypothetical protein